MKIIGKITVKTVTGSKPDLEKLIAKHQEGKLLDIMNVVGIANSIKAGVGTLPDGTKSPFTKLLGAFLATNIETGEQFRSGVAILPPLANNLIAGQLENPDVKGVEFGFKVSARYVKERTIPFEYVVESTIETKQNDPLTLLMAQSTAPALPAPVQEVQQLPTGAPVMEGATEPAKQRAAGGRK